jgi:transcription elongation factor Elf1
VTDKCLLCGAPDPTEIEAPEGLDASVFECASCGRTFAMDENTIPPVLDLLPGVTTS